MKNIISIKDGQGIRFNIIAKLENIRHPIHIDIAPNDPITPAILVNKYRTIINHELIELNTYPYETILAEKLQTVVSLGTASSRAKDLYDLFVIANIFGKSLNKEDAIKAIQTTFSFRSTIDNPNQIINELYGIKESTIQQNLWKNYARKHYFATEIEFGVLVDSVIKLINNLFDI